MRLDPDGQPHYDPYEILVGHYVNPPSALKEVLAKGYLTILLLFKFISLK